MTPKRLLSLDVFRGATIAAMVLVNNPGDWDHIYAPLRHAEWHGWTFTDTVFPFFLWIGGLAMTLSFARRAVGPAANRKALLAHVLRRAVLLYLIGLFLAGFPYFPWHRIRYLGVLQRISICYLLGASMFLFMKARGLILITLGLLGGYWLLMTYAPGPPCGPGNFGPECNFSRYVDGIVLAGHMWSQTKYWDPEGVVSTLPAVATTLFGVLAGYLLRLGRSPAERAVWMFVYGNLLVGAGQILDIWLPINKNLWTSSFSVFMAGLASAAFAILYWLIDVIEWTPLRRAVKPFAVFGMNAITIFVLSGLIGRLLGLIKIGPQSVHTWIYEAVFAPMAAPVNASLLFALANVLSFYLVAWVLYRRNWFLKL